MNCPKCGKPMLDMRGVKTNPKSPDFQCPDAQCLNDKGFRTGAWLPKGNRGTPSPAPGPVSGQPGAIVAPSGRYTELGDLYWKCFNEVLTVLKQEKLVDLFHGDAIAAMVATLFIARSKAS